MTATAIPAAVKDFELTWVVYDPADPLGAALALITLSPVYAPRRSPPNRVRPRH
jgi:hypothetical protein